MSRLAILAVPFLLAACGSGDAPAGGNDAPASSAENEATGEAVALTGEQLFRRCAACHKAEKDAPHGIGPNLHGVVGRAIGSLEGFNYTPALKAKGGIWDEANLNAYIEDPRKFAPGNRMSFAGIKDAGERQAVIDYLKERK